MTKEDTCCPENRRPRYLPKLNSILLPLDEIPIRCEISLPECPTPSKFVIRNTPREHMERVRHLPINHYFCSGRGPTFGKFSKLVDNLYVRGVAPLWTGASRPITRTCRSWWYHPLSVSRSGFPPNDRTLKP